MDELSTKDGGEQGEEQVWPPPPAITGPRVDQDARRSQSAIKEYLLSFVIAFCYWVCTWELSIDMTDHIFRHHTIVQGVYTSELIHALVGVAVALVLMRCKIRLGKPLLIATLIVAAFFMGFEYLTQNVWD